MLRAEYISEQLRAAAPGADWNAGGIDRSAELAKIFDRNNILNLMWLRVESVIVRRQMPGQINPDNGEVISQPVDYDEQNYRFNYNGRPIGFMGTPDRADYTATFELGERGYYCAWSAAGHGHVGYMVRPNKTTKQIEIVPFWDSSSEAGQAREFLMATAQFIAFVALPIAGVSIGASLGSALLGAEFAASYPLVSAAIGNAAISTAFNGGDIASAAKSAAVGAVSSGVGAFAGKQISVITESPFFGAVTNAATRAAIAGGDIKQAVAYSLASQGAHALNLGETVDIIQSLPPEGIDPIDFSKMPPGPLPPTPIPEPIDFYGGAGEGVGTELNFNGGFGFDPLPANSGFNFDPLIIDNSTPAVVSGWEGQGGFGFGFGFEPGTPGFSLDPIITPAVVTPATTLPANSPAFNPLQVVQGITTAALSGLQLVAAFRALNNPQLQTTARRVLPNGTVSVVGNNGVIQTRTAAGIVTTSRPPVGIPQATLDGSFVVNNGDDTYTIVKPNGQSQTLPYARNTGGSARGISSIPPSLLLIGGALVVYAIAKRK